MQLIFIILKRLHSIFYQIKTMTLKKSKAYYKNYMN